MRCVYVNMKKNEDIYLFVSTYLWTLCVIVKQTLIKDEEYAWFS